MGDHEISSLLFLFTLLALKAVYDFRKVYLVLYIIQFILLLIPGCT